MNWYLVAEVAVGVIAAYVVITLLRML